MMKIKNPFSGFSEEAYSVLRMVTGFLFSFHGMQKILGLFTEPSMMPPVGSELWIGGVIELVGGLLILIGFLTPFVAFICSGQMAVAYFQFHWKFAFDNNFFPIVNHGEPSVVYCFLFLYIATKGGGMWSFENSKQKHR